MCGIAGIVDFESKPVEPALLLAMNQAIAHRGPDDEGYTLICQSSSRYTNYAGASSPAAIRAELPTLTPGTVSYGANIGLSHRRFSIIDLSASGHQPFFDKDGACCVVFNGEIYNYTELRDELRDKGVQFYSHSDTEVLVEAYKHWGTDCFSRFNGFWALVLYDFVKKQLLVSRDRIGKKPLYWTTIGSRVLFASEIKALLQVRDVYSRRKVNEEALYYWLVYGQKDLHFTTCFEGIHSFPSASWAALDRDFPNNTTRFWSVPKERLREQDISPNEAATRLRNTLEDAVRIRLRADVPVSVELSGGLDSSTIVALAARVCREKISTYTVRFPDEQCNEEPFARSVARRYQTNYRILESPLANFWSQVSAFTYLEEEPYHSPVLQTNQVIWTQMRSRGTKVSLNGAGGDENFAGYSTYYVPAQVGNLMDGRLIAYIKNALGYSQGRTKILCVSRPVARLARELATRMIGLPWFLNGKAPGYFQGKHYPCLSQPLTLSRALYSDMSNTLMPYWLRSGDRGYMGIPLEVRAPFLDYRVIDFAFQLPIGYLFRNGWHKWILRKAVEDLLPADVVWRKQKLGFPFPYPRFYRDYRGIIDLILNSAENPWIDFAKRNRFRNDWKVLSFILWYEYFFNENVNLFRQIEIRAQQIQRIENYGYEPQYLSSWNWPTR